MRIHTFLNLWFHPVGATLKGGNLCGPATLNTNNIPRSDSLLAFHGIKMSNGRLWAVDRARPEYELPQGLWFPRCPFNAKNTHTKTARHLTSSSQDQKNLKRLRGCFHCFSSLHPFSVVSIYVVASWHSGATACNAGASSFKSPHMPQVWKINCAVNKTERRLPRQSARCCQDKEDRHSRRRMLGSGRKNRTSDL